MDVFFRSHRYLGSHDRKFIAETTYGVLRHLRRCEYQLDEIRNYFIEDDKITLLVVAYLSLEKQDQLITPEVLAEKLKNIQFKVPASELLEKIRVPKVIAAESMAAKIGIEYSFPDWMIDKIIKQYGEQEAVGIFSSLNTQAPLTLRVNTLKVDVNQCREELLKHGVETEATSLSPLGLNVSKRINVFSLPEFRNGWFEVQDEGSQLLPLIVDPKPNAKVLDVCAGAGGKTLAFAGLMKNRGEIFATDINGYRLEELRKRTRRAGVQNVRVQEIKAVEDLEDKFKEHFDIVFVDAPCSGLGTIRRNPGMKWRVMEETVREVSEKQKNILHSSVSLLKPNGTLVYATCTLLSDENEDIIQGFLRQHPDFTIAKPKLDMLPTKVQQEFMQESYFKLLPHIHGTDGFFCALLKRKDVH